MSKSICALVHKAGSTREAFQRYYEANHAPLAIGLFPFSGYVRNHVVEGGDFGWDTISEFWSADIAKAAALMEGPIGETMRADEERFMDRSRIAPGGAEEVVIAPGPRAAADGRRTAVLVAGNGDKPAPRQAVLALARALAAGRGGVSVDFVTAWQEPAFPAEAVIWVPGGLDDLPAPAGIALRPLRVRCAETPPADLLGAA